jgi:acetylornithine/N-succinyldiaminopimelate aminotransferase
MTGQAELLARWQGALMDNYGTPATALVRGEGATVWDADGNSFVDMYAGIAVTVLGHAHPAVVNAVTAQISTLAHVSNMFATIPAVTLAERLLSLSGRDGKVYLCNSGAEANEAAFKLARRTGRTHIVAAQNAFHGRTMGALALTGQPAKRDPFLPLPGDVTHVPFGDADALAAAVTGETAMVILEPILGEAGVVTPPKGYLARAREIATANGALLCLDEIQTGIGRTGAWFAHQADGVLPDIVTLAKGLGGGLPLGACIAYGETAALFGPGSHGSTFGGNPVCCAAALAVIDTIAGEDLLGRAKHLGQRIRTGIEALGHPLVSHVRGSGLLLGVVLTSDVAKGAELALRQAGFLVNAIAPGVLRLAPPLILTDEQADAFVSAVPGALDSAQEGAE